MSTIIIIGGGGGGNKMAEDGSNTIVDRNGNTVAVFDTYDDAIAYLQLLNSQAVG